MAQNSAENLEKIYKNSVEKLQHSLKSTELTGAILNLIYYNDLAALNLKFNKFKTASLYCRRATLIIPQLNNEDLGRHAELLSQLLYNHGLVLLSIQQPTLAHSCWHLSALFQQHTTNHPRFWIRLAECCITHHLLLGKEKDEQLIKEQVKALYDLRRRILAQQSGHVTLSMRNSFEGDNEDPLSLTKAVTYLQNAIQLLQGSNDHVTNLHAHLLVTWVSLELRDYITALHNAREGLALPMDAALVQNCAGELTALYCHVSEALALLNDLAGASQALLGSAAEQQVSTLLVSLETKPVTGPCALHYALQLGQPSALSPVLANLAILSMAKSDMSSAELSLAKAVAADPSATATVELQTYFQLAQGNPDAALDLFSKHRLLSRAISPLPDSVV
jgi:hypothetical protein